LGPLLGHSGLYWTLNGTLRSLLDLNWDTMVVIGIFIGTLWSLLGHSGLYWDLYWDTTVFIGT